MPSTLETCTSSSRPASPSAGDTLFETDTNNIITYSGAGWYVYDADGGETITNAKSLHFDGSDDGLDDGNDDGLTVAGSSALDLDNNFTISGWFKTDSNISWSGLIWWGENLPAKSRGFGLDAGNHLIFNGYAKFHTSGQTTISPGTWYHGAATVEENTNLNQQVATVYVNGATDSIAFENTGLADFTYSNTVIGQSNYGGIEHFDGMIDEVAVWNKVLSPAEITAIYNSGVANFNLLGNTGNYHSKSSLVGWWRMGDGTENGSGTTIYDMSTNSNNMTMVTDPGNDPPSYVTDVPS